METKIFTHTDLDGVGGAIVAKQVFPEAKVFSCSNSDVDRIVLDNTTQFDEVIIVDLALKPETLSSLEELIGEEAILYADHHKTSEQFKDKSYVYFDTNECGTSMLYKALLTDFKDVAEEKELSKLALFTQLVRDHDLWIHESNTSSELDVLYRFLGFDYFLERFLKSPSPTFTVGEKVVLYTLLKSKAKYLEEHKDCFVQLPDNYFLEGKRGVMTLETGYINELLNNKLLSDPNIDFALSINLGIGTCSIRSLDDSAYLIAIANNGGGHPRAAGFTLRHDIALDVLNTVLNKEEL